MNVLLTGGAGYIGSHVVRALQLAGHRCVVYDNLSKGHRQAVDGMELVVGDVCDSAALRDTFKKFEIEAVINLAAFIEAGESVEKPKKYFENNTLAGFTLLNAMRDCGVNRLVFSSTAAVYGTPERTPILETDRLAPINPYGASKLCVEYMMQAYARAYGMGFVALRYFNVAGAHPSGQIGEDHSPETHLLPLILQVASGKREKILIFGDDYDTPDGTCIRDYIHVCDLADAHVLAVDAVEQGQVRIFNLGNGEGFSVNEVIETCRRVTGKPIAAQNAQRRPGDPDRLVASSCKAVSQLNWKPKFPHIETIVEHAWKWHSSHPDGYGK
ncbi:MAG TPA: UDP-glucose 4-epimerase GalE [Phycisphaerae bacterium]|nr:UDP-glucose 4-epimerase GalE [Phycisphaerae bacterium]HPS53262.1 UDP-glucose 4-epimerase GalE [Phycisphaerae bacterium]